MLNIAFVALKCSVLKTIESALYAAAKYLGGGGGMEDFSPLIFFVTSSLHSTFHSLSIVVVEYHFLLRRTSWSNKFVKGLTRLQTSYFASPHFDCYTTQHTYTAIE